ncbi:ANKRD17 [Symbiodinium sp. KB8]|nr:ANKRD17 [Symbiodinium sp. KB8]
MFAPCCANAPTSSLELHAQQLRDAADQNVSSKLQQFAMYVVPLEVLLSMSKPTAYETLLDDGVLVEYEEGMGNAMFVSHQWTGSQHPDIAGEQFVVLKDALQALKTGKVDISGNISIELYMGLQNSISAKEIFSRPLFIWYDYICCPQHATAFALRQMAVNSIPAYVDRCQFFAILCPHVRHEADNVLLNKRNWASRGWCRMEQMAQELSTKQKCVSIEIHGATHVVEAPTYGWIQAPVGGGQFTLPSDRDKLAPVVQDMVRRKLHAYLARGDLASYRMMLNMQNVHYRNLPLNPVDDILPGYVSNNQDPATALMENFMYQNGFDSIDQRTADGWSPMCFAALDGRPLLLAALLDNGADVNDRVTQQSSSNTFGLCPLVHICAFLSHNEALQLLIDRKADVKARDGYSTTALAWAGFSDNVAGIHALIAAGADPTMLDMIGYAPFALASSAGAISSMTALLPYTPRQQIDKSLLFTMLQGGGSAEVVSTLVALDADVNHQASTPLLSPLGIWFGCLSLRHQLNESKLSAYAYHYEGLTPLMCSVLTSSYEATAVLLGVGARTDLRNARGKTALDLARETSAPDHIAQALADEGDARQELVREVAEFIDQEVSVAM